jgi:hypothetical protein
MIFCSAWPQRACRAWNSSPLNSIRRGVCEFNPRFHFHVIERLAAPASPLLLVSDLLRGGLGGRDGIVGDAMDFISQLLEVNTSRVQTDVDERLRGSRSKLEAESKALLKEGSTIAERAFAHARVAQSAGKPAVAKARARLDSVEREVRSLL